MKLFGNVDARFLAGILSVAILSLGLYVPAYAPRAYAVVPTAETNPVMLGNILATSIAAVDQTLITKTLNALAWRVAKIAIQTMSKSIVNWINGGFEGSPAFETDLQNSLRRLGDGVAQGFLTQMANEAVIRSPFSDELITGVGAAYYLYSGREGLKERLRYTLNQSAADDKAFLAGDFSQGGWNAWFSAFQNPANNAFGAQMIASQALATQVSTAANQRVAELGWGSGFLSWKGDCINGKISKEASTLIDEVGATGKTADLAYLSNLSDAEGCLEHEIETPGSVIEGTLIPNLNSPLHQLELADSINEIIGALAQQLVSKVVGGSGLRSVSKPSQGGGRSALAEASDPAQYSASVSSLSAGFKSGVSASQAQVGTYRSAWQKIGAAAATAKTVCGSSSVVETTIAKSAAALAKADKASAALGSIQTRTSALTSDGNEAVELTSITNSYLELLSDGTLPDTQAMVEASTESQDTDDANPGSLYSQMTRLSNPLLCARSGT